MPLLLILYYFYGYLRPVTIAQQWRRGSVVTQWTRRSLMLYYILYLTYLYNLYGLLACARCACFWGRLRVVWCIIIIQQYEIYYNSWSPLWSTPLDRNTKCGYTVSRALLCRYNMPKKILYYVFILYIHVLLYCGCGNARLRTSSVLQWTSLRQTKKEKIAWLVVMNMNIVTIRSLSQILTNT